MNWMSITFIAISIAKLKAESIQTKIKAYFDSDVVQSFDKTWKSYAFAYENAIGNALKEDYGRKTMNVYINRLNKPLLIASGYYHTDNQVKLVFKDMVLEALPHMYDVDISFPLASNLVLVEASVSKMILHTSYVLFRNKSDVIFSPADQDPYKNSPFRFQQVRNIGDLAISLEGCSLSGIIVATLSGKTVNLGHNELRLKDCQYNVEIYKLGSGTPPVIVNYLPKGERGLNLETLVSKPMLEELVPKLQGAMFSEVNTSALFSNNLSKIRAKQEAIFESTKTFVDEVVRSMNRKSIEKNMGTIDLEDFSIAWDDVFTEVPSAKSLKLSEMTLLGLDTVFASHAGGPVQLTEIEIIEQLRFSTLQVIGKVLVEGLRADGTFAVEISDLAVDVTIDSNQNIKFEVLGWRFLEFSCPDLEFLPIESLVVGYLLNEVPKHIKTHLNSVYEGKHVKINQEYVGEQPVDGKYPLDMNTSEMSDYRHSHENIHEEQTKSQQHKLEQALLHDHLSEVEPHEEESGEARLRHRETKPHRKDHDSKTNRQDKMHHNKTSIKRVEAKSGSIKTHNKENNNNKTSAKITDEKTHKKAAKTKINMHSKNLNKMTQKQMNNRNQRTKVSAATPKVVHLSDNEIQSN